MAQITEIRLPDGRVLRPSDWKASEPLYSTIEVTSGQYQTLSAFSYPNGGDVPGSNGPRPARDADTNLYGDGARLEDDQELVIYSMMVEAFAINEGTGDGYTDAQFPVDGFIPVPDMPFVSLTDILRMQRDFVLRLRIATSKDQTIHPLGWFPAGTGPVLYPSSGLSVIASQSAVAARGFQISNNGNTDADDRRVFASPFYVDGGESLGVDFIAPTGTIGGSNVPAAVWNTPISVANAAADQGRIRLRTFLDGFRRLPVA